MDFSEAWKDHCLATPSSRSSVFTTISYFLFVFLVKPFTTISASYYLHLKIKIFKKRKIKTLEWYIPFIQMRFTATKPDQNNLLITSTVLYQKF
ncbi:Uncharacterized protein TCM_007643 [Theobroma cacao]|uniref:Uncharacterized protein n=1 Tax=Theobroma cacao TaxID=3641 RepID=A0A061E209_THECC|nr:Uncharacterized protein TCM_007643 [Theobroma cacao]